MFGLSVLDKETRDATWDLHADEVIVELCHAYSSDAADLASSLDLSEIILNDGAEVEESS